jgi:uncharacterized membrane protein YgcG
MKRFLLGVMATALLAATGMSSPSFAAVNDFTIQSFTIDYYLGADNSGHSTLKTVETITADFPATDQNHGLERAIPASYEGHPTQLNVQSVTDTNGNALPYSVSDSSDNQVLRIGNASQYVHGLNTYVVTYTQRDVTRYFADTGKDEFYWDTNGTQWAVPISQLQVRIHLDHSITPTFTRAMACYEGVAGATNKCELTQDNDTISTTLSNLQPYRNVTVSLGFTAGTFIGYQQSFLEKLLPVLVFAWVAAIIITSILAVVALVWLIHRYSRVASRRSELGTIVPEYLPPRECSVLVAAHLEGNATKALTAELIDLAVRHYIKIYQTGEKSMFKAAQYELELVRPIDDLAKEEQALLALLFPQATIGSRFVMASLSNNYLLGQQISSVLTTGVAKDIRSLYGIREKNAEESRWFRRFGTITLIIAIVTVSPLLLIAAVTAFCLGMFLWPLTDKGLQLRRYLRGLKLYISVAEVDRLKMLQSPEGAIKVGEAIDANNSGQLVKLYERVLPYAVLFGQEKEWNAQLGAHYETANTQPDWYSGSLAFNAVTFGTVMSSFSTTASSYVASSSSSFGGSGGGGFSGGGGGGGGGGGW